MSTLSDQLKIEATNALNRGYYLLAARFCELLAELEIQTQIADVNGDDAWNARTAGLPTLTPPAPTLTPAPGQTPTTRETVCLTCGTQAYVDVIEVTSSDQPDNKMHLVSRARHSNVSLSLDHPVKLK